MASVRVVQTARAGALIKDLVPLVDGEVVRLKRRDGLDAIRVGLSLEEQWALREQLAERPRRPTPIRLEVGLDIPPGWLEIVRPALAAARPAVVRIEWDRVPRLGQADSTVQAALQAGARPQFLITDWQQTSTTQIVELVGRYPSVRHVELGNEDSYSYKSGDPSTAGYREKARRYALKAREVAESLPEGVGLLVQADDGNTGSSAWVDAMFAAVPDLHRWAAGWTIHPYGPQYADRLARLVAQTTRRGAPADHPIFITEWGLSTDNGRLLSDNYRWPKDMTYAQAADTFRRVLDDIRGRFGQVQQVIVFNAVDGAAPGQSVDREHYFGLLRRDGTPKAPIVEALRQAG